MGGRFDKDPYFNQKRARRILTGVLLLHVALIAVPLIYSSLTEFFDPPVIVMKVGLADLPLGDSPDAGAAAPADTSVAEPDPVSVDDIPDPKSVADLPPDLPPPPPKVETPPKPKDDPAPTVTPPKPKDDPKQTVKPPPKTETKNPPKTETKNPPKQNNLLKPEDIIKPKNTRTQAQIDAERRAREAAEARAKAEAEARQRAIADIRAAAGTQQGRYGTTNPGQEGILATKEMRDYYEQLNAYIRPKWSAVSPSNIEIGGNISNWPTIDLTISKKGEVTNAVFVSQSGNKKIDDAVKQLLANLKVVPAPPQAATIRVTLDIR